jgi:hypothetical protein
MAIEPKNTREHILALYGYLTGVRRDISQIKNNQKVKRQNVKG